MTNHQDVYTFKVDERGRIILPKELRARLNVEPGDVLYARPDGKGFSVIKGENPFDALAEEAVREHKQGKTKTADEVFGKLGI